MGQAVMGVINSERIQEEVCSAYSRVADEPGGRHPFPVGRGFAESIGYDKKLLDILPSAVVDAFTGVSNVSVFAQIMKGSTVLDLGCGAGMDSFIASQRTGQAGTVFGIDFSEAMISRAVRALAESNIRNIVFQVAEAEKLPLKNKSVDVALVNGIFNLSPRRESIFSELSRVVKKGGAVYSAELILKEGAEVSGSHCDIGDWFT